jgi:hypothetical protein
MVNDSHQPIEEQTLGMVFVLGETWEQVLKPNPNTRMAIALKPFLALVRILRKPLPWSVRWTVFLTGKLPMEMQAGDFTKL